MGPKIQVGGASSSSSGVAVTAAVSEVPSESQTATSSSTKARRASTKIVVAGGDDHISPMDSTGNSDGEVTSEKTSKASTNPQAAVDSDPVSDNSAWPLRTVNSRSEMPI